MSELAHLVEGGDPEVASCLSFQTNKHNTSHNYQIAHAETAISSGLAPCLEQHVGLQDDLQYQ